MIELGTRFLYTPAWEGFSIIAIMAGLAGIIALLFGLDETRKARPFSWGAIGLMLVAMAFSMFFEEILPMWPSIPEARRVPYALSYAGFMLFIVMFIWSGRKLMAGGLFMHFPRLFKAGPHRAEAVQALRPGLLWFGATAVVMAVSLLGYHGIDVILGRSGA